VGTMFSGCHPRIIVPLTIPSLLGTYASASQAFESLNLLTSRSVHPG
jgi:hypothetical protein